MSYYLHLLRVYIEALEPHSQLSRPFNSSTLQSLHQLSVGLGRPLKPAELRQLVGMDEEDLASDESFDSLDSK